MGEVRLEKHPAVLDEDLADIYSFIAKDDAVAALRVMDAAGETFSLLAREPESGVLYRTENSKLPGVKMIPVVRYRNYLVFYRAGEDGDPGR